MTFNYFQYSGVLINPEISFIDEMGEIELNFLIKALKNHSLTPEQNKSLKEITGCQTYSEFRRRMFPTHQLIDPEKSILKIETIEMSHKKTEITFSAIVYGRDSVVVAKFRRRLNFKDKKAEHLLLNVDPRFRRKGVASIIAQSHEDAWTAAGYESVYLEAGKQNGQTVWALHGYDFDPSETVRRKRIRNTLEMELKDAVGRQAIDSDFAEAVMHAMDEFDLRAWEVQALEADDGDNFGRRAIGSTDWKGVKQLREDWPGHPVAARTRAPKFLGIK